MPTKKRSSSGSLAGRYKKQHGLHHNKSRHYLKVYYPYLPVVVIVIFGIAASLFIIAHKSISSSSTISQSNLLTETNADRQLNNEKPLTLNPALSKAAQIKADDMVKNNYWSHIGPNGLTPWSIMLSLGYKFQSAGENLAYGFNNSFSVLQAWMSSPSHRASILNSSYQQVGFGIAHSNNYQNKGPQTIVVAIYASPMGQTLSQSISNSSAYSNMSTLEPTSRSINRMVGFVSLSPLVSTLLIGIVLGLSIGVLVIRHGLIIKRWALKGESLVINHPFIDITLVIILILGAILSQTIGYIR